MGSSAAPRHSTILWTQLMKRLRRTWKGTLRGRSSGRVGGHYDGCCFSHKERRRGDRKAISRTLFAGYVLGTWIATSRQCMNIRPEFGDRGWEVILGYTLVLARGHSAHSILLILIVHSNSRLLSADVSPSCGRVRVQRSVLKPLLSLTTASSAWRMSPGEEAPRAARCVSI